MSAQGFVSAMFLLSLLNVVTHASAISLSTEGLGEAAGNIVNNLKGWMHLDSGDSREGPVRVMARYTVPPREVEAFINHWSDIREEVEKEEGNEHYYLHKTMTDNVEFFLYGMWSDYDAFSKHLSSEYAKKFHEFHMKHGVVWKREMVKQLARGGEQPKKVGTGRFHVLINYKVLPSISQVGMFEEAFEEHAKQTVEEKANHELVLVKPWDDNVNYYAWGNWESKDAYEEHFKREETKQFLKKVQNANVAWFLMPAWEVGQEGREGPEGVVPM